MTEPNVAVTCISLPLALVIRHALWADAKFGDPSERGPIGPLKHLGKETAEVVAAWNVSPVPESSDDVAEEFADCTFLLIDAMRRAGMTNERLIRAMEMKMPRLEARSYTKGGTDEPSEHDRTGEAPKNNPLDEIEWPAVGSKWKHRNGNIYEVYEFTNTESEKQDRYPTRVSYQNVVTGSTYSRALVDWHRSMTPVA